MFLKKLMVTLILSSVFTSISIGLVAHSTPTAAKSRFRPIATLHTVGGPCGQTIQDCIDFADPGDTILIPAGTYTESLTLSEPISLTGVSSATAIIRAAAGRVLTVNGAAIDGSVVISGLTIADGDVTGGSTCPTYCGGGLLITGTARPLVQNVTLINNRAGSIGGGIYARQMITINHSHFQGNQADVGGGAYSFESLTLNRSSFVENEAASVAGGAGANENLTVNQGRFEGNTADFGGGAVAVGELIIDDTLFVRNIVSSSGGGALAPTVTVRGGQFVGNEAQSFFGGGGGLLVNDTLVVRDAEFVDNIASDSGGGILSIGTSNLNNVNFEGNQAFLGGGIQTEGSSTIHGGRFEQNIAIEGGGIGSVSPLTISGTRFISNTAIWNGGGLLVTDTTILTAAYFAGNRASSISGGGLKTVAPLQVVDSQFINNSAAEAGGGLFAGQMAVVKNTHFEGNRADVIGGGLASGGPLTLENTTLVNNSTETAGGGLGTNGPATLTDVQFIGNDSGTGGGGLLAGGVLTMSDSIFLSNTAELDGGGAVTLEAATINGGRFEQNRCTRTLFGCSGGGLQAQGDLEIAAVEFIDNRAGVGGGLSFEEGNGSGRIINVLFARNRADEGAALRLASEGQVTVLHNTIVDTSLNPQQAIAVISGTVGVTNTIMANHATGLAQVGGVVREDYNLYADTSLNMSGSIASGGHSLSGEAKFVDPAGDDYRLGSTSDALDQGLDVGVLTDLLGNSRPQEDGFDIGAYEGTFKTIPPEKNIYLPIVLKG